MKLSRHLTTSRRQYVSDYSEHIEHEPGLDFETIFKVSFALENQVEHERQVWIVQDEDEDRPHKRRLKESNQKVKDGGSPLLSIKLKIIFLLDLFSFMGIVWFVLTKIVFGPVSSLLIKQRYAADVEHRVIYDA